MPRRRKHQQKLYNVKAFRASTREAATLANVKAKAPRKCTSRLAFTIILGRVGMLRKETCAIRFLAPRSSAGPSGLCECEFAATFSLSLSLASSPRREYRIKATEAPRRTRVGVFCKLSRSPVYRPPLFTLTLYRFAFIFRLVYSIDVAMYNAFISLILLNPCSFFFHLALLYFYSFRRHRITAR